MNNNYTVLIGDANGADKSIQEYLAIKGFQNVIVFCMDGTYRNNIGNWETRHINANQKRHDFNYYATKDLAMAEEADYGFMIWDAKSKGTLNNIINLLEREKKILVYLSPVSEFYTIGMFDDLEKLLIFCDGDVKLRLYKQLDVDRRLGVLEKEFEFV